MTGEPPPCLNSASAGELAQSDRPSGDPPELQVLALWWRGDCLCGVLEILRTPGGKRVRDAYAAGALLGASVRAWTSLASEHGRHLASEDLQIIAYGPPHAFGRAAQPSYI